MQTLIPNRKTAGKWLAEQLLAIQPIENPIVLALPRGGVPVAFEIAKALNCPLDLLLVRKLGTPGFPELAMGAIASAGIKLLNQSVINRYQIPNEAIAEVEAKERVELQRREQAYRGNRPNLALEGQNIILVDDGLATGYTLFSAIDAIKQYSPNSITVAVPVAPPEVIKVLSKQVDTVICPLQPQYFSSIGEWYENFSQVTDKEVKTLLEQAWQA